MPVTFPVNLFDYLSDYGRLRPMRRRFDITDPRTYAESNGGQGYINSFGTSLWYGSLQVTPLHTSLMRPLEARMRLLLRADAIFLLGDPMDDPARDSPGAPNISAVSTTTGVLTIKGFNPGYAIPAGLRLGFKYGTRYAYHETSEKVSANSSGIANVEVFPPIEPGWAANTPIKLGSDAIMAATMVPGSWEPGEADATQTQGFTFTFRQSLRT